MIKPGNLVYLCYQTGLKKNQPYTKTIGLVIKELKEKGAIPQFYVQFDDQETPKWYYQHDLYKVKNPNRRKEKNGNV